MNTIKVVYPNLIKGLKEMKEEVKEECLDIFADFFKKFGNLLNKKNDRINKDELMKILCELLMIKHDGVRKKATNCLGQFAIILSSKQLQQLVLVLIDRLQRSQ